MTAVEQAALDHFARENVELRELVVSLSTRVEDLEVESAMQSDEIAVWRAMFSEAMVSGVANAALLDRARVANRALRYEARDPVGQSSQQSAA